MPIQSGRAGRRTPKTGTHYRDVRPAKATDRSARSLRAQTKKDPGACRSIPGRGTDRGPGLPDHVRERDPRRGPTSPGYPAHLGRPTDPAIARQHRPARVSKVGPVATGGSRQPKAGRSDHQRRRGGRGWGSSVRQRSGGVRLGCGGGMAAARWPAVVTRRRAADRRWRDGGRRKRKLVSVRSSDCH